MLAYVTLGTRDLDRAAAFYDALLPLVGGKRMMEEAGYYIAWSDGSPNAGLGITYPFDKAQATVGNGTMVALQAPSPEVVDAVHARALELGAGTLALTALAPLMPLLFPAFAGPLMVLPSAHDLGWLLVLALGCTLVPFALSPGASTISAACARRTSKATRKPLPNRSVFFFMTRPTVVESDRVARVVSRSGRVRRLGQWPTRSSRR